MAAATKANMITPEVIIDLITAKGFDWELIREAMVFSTISVDDDSLVGKPGDKVTVARYNYIGDAEDLTEGVEMDVDPISTAEKISPVIKEVGKTIGMSQASLEIGRDRYETIEEGRKQIVTAFKNKMDKDIVASLATTPLVYDHTAADPVNWNTVPLSFNAITQAKAKFQDEEEETYVLFIHPDQEIDIINDDKFFTAEKIAQDILIKGAIGMIAGCQIVKTRRIAKDTTTPLKGFWTNYLVKPGAVKMMRKRDIDIYADFYPKKRQYELSANSMYVTWLKYGDHAVQMKVGINTDSGAAPARYNANEGQAETSNA